MGYVEAFRRNIGDLLGLQMLDKREAFAFFRLLVNLEPGVAAAERLKYDRHVDYFLPSLPLACTDNGVRVGDIDLEVLSLREPPARTYPNLLRDLVPLESDFILCSEFKRVLNDSAINTIRTAQNHFHWSQWVADIPSIVSMVLNRGKRENVIADKTALNDVEDLDKTLARIKNDGEYLGEFSFPAIIYTRGESAKRKSAAADVQKAPYTFILDLGGSYRQITRKHGGSYVEMRFGDTGQSFRINPFVLPGTPDNLQFLFTFVRLLLTNGGYEPTVDDDRELFEAVESMYVFSEDQRTLRNLAFGLPPHLLSLLRPWIADGQYGTVFDNEDDTLTFAQFQTFDFQGMDELDPQVLEPLLFYVFQRISQVAYDPARVRSPKQLRADEVWRFLSNGTARQYLVAAGKTWRKHNGGIGLITQSAVDLQNAGVLHLVNEICPTRILLANPGADLGSYQQMFRLNEREVELFSAFIPKRQFLWKTPDRAKVLNLNLDPRAYWEYTNSPYDNERRRQAVERHGTEEGLKVLEAQAR